MAMRHTVKLHRAYNANGTDTGAVYRIVDRSAGISYFGQQNPDCNVTLRRMHA